MNLILENVRGFSERVEIPIGNLTLLVGENSTGKSTILAMLQAALNPSFPFGENLFNNSPFGLGSFDTIATYKGGKYGRAETFTVGIRYKGKDRDLGLSAVFTNNQGSPVVQYAKWTAETAQLEMDRLDSADGYSARLETKASNGKKKGVSFSFSVRVGAGKRRSDRKHDLRTEIFEALVSQLTAKQDRNVNLPDALGAMWDALSANGANSLELISLAPLRSKPRRTYDEAKDEFKPEGDHIPLLLSRLANGNAKDNERVERALKIFGTSSNLFNSIRIKRLGKRPSDPFQVRIKGDGPDVNMVDVGYGVSQALPIVVDSILARSGQMLLVQQPEVHLHPRAQAALGSFFVALVEDEQKQFVIETHSDYLVDRVRQEIANKKIDAGMVKLLFLKRVGVEIKLYDLELDSMGNIQNAPPYYREFFLEEELNLLLRGGDHANNS